MSTAPHSRPHLLRQSRAELANFLDRPAQVLEVLRGVLRPARLPVRDSHSRRCRRLVPVLSLDLIRVLILVLIPDRVLRLVPGQGPVPFLAPVPVRVPGLI